MTALKLENVTIRYGGTVVVDGVSLAVEEGELLCIAGANGSGKSSLLRGILGLVPLAGGRVERGRAAFVPQSEDADRDFPATVWEVVLTGTQCPGWRLPLYSRSGRKAAARAIADFGLTSLARHEVGTLSGGQMRRVLLARALSGHTGLLLLDEPCTGLDPAIRRLLYGLLGRRCHEEGTAVLMVTHNLNEVRAFAGEEALSGRVAFMEHGRLSVAGPLRSYGEEQA
ncbi:MAG: ATP-binding cassette domain-containing protein [Fretibacterium sp.]|nr:ATP-binding cassette domain-containing protein [Fretibacterium sp.]